jgi:hypothetical protein
MAPRYGWWPAVMAASAFVVAGLFARESASGPAPGQRDEDSKNL